MASVTKKGRQQPPLRHMHVRMVDLDNCKGVFMFYVVVYHFFNNWILDQAIQDWPSEFWKNFFISYTYWHEKMAVPGFSFLSGLLGKGFDNYYDGSDSKKENDKRKQRWQASISTLLVGPFLMQLFNIGMKIIVLSLFPVEKQEDERDENQDTSGDATEGASASDNPILPNVIFDYDFLETWYLLALFGWRILTPVFLRLLRYPLSTSLCLAFLHSHVSFDWSDQVRFRFFRYFPFYVAGLLTDKSALDRVHQPFFWGSIGTACTLLFACIIQNKQSFFFIHYFNFDWSWRMHAILLSQYIYSSVAVLSILFLVRPVKFTLFPFTHSNSTLAIYLWHWKALEVFLWGQIPFSQHKIQIWETKTAFHYFQNSTSDNIFSPHHPFVAILLLHVGSYFICVVLGSKWLWKLFRYVNDPNCGFLFRSDDSILGESAVRHDSYANATDQRDDGRKYDGEVASLPSSHMTARFLTNRSSEDQMLKKV